MAELLLINPRGRRKARATPKRRRTTAKRRRNPARALVVAAPVRRRRLSRRRNPIGAVRSRIGGVRRAGGKRRRNPISLGSATGWINMIKDAAIGGSGAVAMDLLMGQLNPHLPVSMQTNPTTLGTGDAVKAVITVILGKLLDRPTRGISRKMAMGALTVQASQALSTFVPATMPLAGRGGRGGLAYMTPAKLANQSARFGPNAGSGMGQFITGGRPTLGGVGRFTNGAPQFVHGGERAGVLR